MDRLTLALVIAQNGLRTAAGLLTAKAAKAESQAGSASGADATKLKKDATKARKLAAALNAADAGITSYLTESAS